MKETFQSGSGTGGFLIKTIRVVLYKSGQVAILDRLGDLIRTFKPYNTAECYETIGKEDGTNIEYFIHSDKLINYEVDEYWWYKCLQAIHL